MLHVLHDRLLPDRFFYPPLRLNVERIGIQALDLALLRELRVGMARPRLSEKFSETPWVVHCCVDEIGLHLDLGSCLG